MKLETNSIDFLIEKTMQAELELGLSKQSVYGSQSCFFNSIKKFFKRFGNGLYSEEVMEEYRIMLLERAEKKELCHTSYINRLKLSERIEEMYETGKLTWSCKTRISKFVLTTEYENILADFISQSDFHKNTRGDYIWIVRKYLSFLQLEGCNCVSKITSELLMKYIIYCTEHLKRSTLKDIMCYTKRFHKYLEESGQSTVAYRGILEISVMRETKVQKAISTEELNSILEVIDVSETKGKRNYSVILLGAVLGLRAVDIVNLKLRDIDWRKNEIRLLQQKTGKFVILPLPKEVGNAMKDYILNARPQNEEEYIFLRLKAPFKKIDDSRSIGNMFESYQSEANIKRTPFDGKGFHSLRRRLGREMVLEGIPVETIAEVLGHSSIESANQYISLDSVSLQDCSLSFDGIGCGTNEKL